MFYIMTTPGDDLPSMVVLVLVFLDFAMMMVLCSIPFAVLWIYFSRYVALMVSIIMHCDQYGTAALDQEQMCSMFICCKHVFAPKSSSKLVKQTWDKHAKLALHVYCSATAIQLASVLGF